MTIKERPTSDFLAIVVVENTKEDDGRRDQECAA